MATSSITRARRRRRLRHLQWENSQSIWKAQQRRKARRDAFFASLTVKRRRKPRHKRGPW